MTENLLLDDRTMLMFIEKERLKTFKGWPNDSSWHCTPEKLAQAGFYFSPCSDCPDNVCCIFCLKELDGWEPDDDPVKEHTKHSPKCPFLTLKKPVENLTTTEFVKLAMEILMIKTEKIFDKNIKEFEEQGKVNRSAITDHINGN
ncbi:baculoviral IAP repeat-containing protein 5-like [Physella acuta]|uniref:baculoviral IAP repeat-containing protein 5-like n=1 Tax=Physella acuta TaxID=109671 RepID=UPI0027DD3CF9|nr:baculoviral IAP repeat-containing protein 5-like [Physella acuta]XP_059156921.1 baculoviral IAP repeat-containing protein 5-like [Physella acuta]